MTYLEKYREMGGKKIEEEELVRFYCPAEFFGVPKEHCKGLKSEKWAPVTVTEATAKTCRACWNREYDESNYPTQFMTKITDVRKQDFTKEMVQSMQAQPLGMQRLAARIATEILESETFLDAYPFITDQKRIQKILTNFLHKNRVSTEDGRAFFRELAESYRGV